MRCYTQHDIERYEKLSDNKFKNVHTNEMFAYLDGVDKGIEELEKIKAEIGKLPKQSYFVSSDGTMGGYRERCTEDYEVDVLNIIDNRIKELKGE